VSGTGVGSAAWQSLENNFEMNVVIIDKVVPNINHRHSATVTLEQCLVIGGMFGLTSFTFNGP